MPTSKLPVEFAPVPLWLYELSRDYPGVLCNLRPNQRGTIGRESISSDALSVHKPVRQFLKALRPKSKVLMHFQGYGVNDLGTALVTIDEVYWTNEPYPRLDFTHLPEIERIHGSNFWGAFILGIVAAPETAQEFAKEDPDGELFINTVQALELGKERPPMLFFVGYYVDDSADTGHYEVRSGQGKTVASSLRRNVAALAATILNNLPQDIDPLELISAFGCNLEHQSTKRRIL